jgi:cytochrome c-type biogenesis protein CcmH
MTVLIIAAVALLGASVWLLARPLAHPVGANESEEYHQRVQMRERLLAQLNELDTEAGGMEAAVVAEERTRLEADLAQVLRRLEILAPAITSAATPVSARTRRMTVVALLILLPAVAIGLYAGKQSKTLEQAALLGPGGQPDPLKMVARLEQRLAREPNDPAGWVRLGRSYAVLQRFDDAKRALARAAQLAPQDPVILADYATLLIAENPREPSREAVAMFTKLYTLNPKHPGALWALGLNAYNAGKFRDAVKYWEGLLKQLPPDAEVLPQVKQALQQARAKANAGKQ